MSLTCDEHLGVVRLRERHRMETRIRRDLARGKADASHGHSQRLAPTPWSEEGLLGHLAEGSNYRHLDSHLLKGESSIRMSHVMLQQRSNKRFLQSTISFLLFMRQSHTIPNVHFVHCYVWDTVLKQKYFLRRTNVSFHHLESSGRIVQWGVPNQTWQREQCQGTKKCQ